MGQSPSATPWALSSCGLVPSPNPRPWGPAAPRPPTLLSLCTRASGGVWVFSWVRCHRDEVGTSPALRLGALLGSPQHQSGHWGSPSRWLGVGSGQGVQGCSAWGAEAPGSPRAPMLGVGAAACNKCRMLWGGVSQHPRGGSRGRNASARVPFTWNSSVRVQRRWAWAQGPALSLEWTRAFSAPCPSVVLPGPQPPRPRCECRTPPAILLASTFLHPQTPTPDRHRCSDLRSVLADE